MQVSAPTTYPRYRTAAERWVRSTPVAAPALLRALVLGASLSACDRRSQLSRASLGCSRRWRRLSGSGRRDPEHLGTGQVALGCCQCTRSLLSCLLRTASGQFYWCSGGQTSSAARPCGWLEVENSAGWSGRPRLSASLRCLDGSAFWPHSVGQRPREAEPLCSSACRIAEVGLRPGRGACPHP